MIQPQTIASELIDELYHFLKSGKKYSNSDHKLAQLEAKAFLLAKANAGEGYVMLAACSMLKGNFAEMNNRYKIAVNQSLSAVQKLNHATTLCHAGFFSEASEIISDVAHSTADPILVAHKAMMCYQFSLAGELFEKATKMKLSANGDDNFLAIPSIVSAVNLPDSQILDQVNLAGEIMRKSNVFQKGEADLSISPKDDGQSECVLATFNIPVSFDDASDMNFSFAEQVIKNGWQHNNFIVRFCGDFA